MQAQAFVMLAIGVVRAAWGMGLRPMLELSRPAYPMARGRESLGRVSLASRGPHVTSVPVGRVVKRSKDPRPLTSAKACPLSCLKDKRAGGAPALCFVSCAGSGSVEMPCILEELAPATPCPQAL